MNDPSRRRARRGLSIRRRTPIGAPPGTLVADPSLPKPVIRVMAYGPDGLDERAVERPEDLAGIVGSRAVTWIDVAGLGDAGIIGKIGDSLGLHKLAMEDVINVHQRPKVDTFHGSMFVVARMPERIESDHGTRMGTDQLSMFLGRNYILTFQERPGDCFDAVRARVRGSSGNIRSLGPDYLMYALIDSVIDSFFPMLEEIGESLEELDDRVLVSTHVGLLRRIQATKRDLLLARRAVWPLRDAVGTLYRDTTPLICEETRLFLRDAYDHTVQIIDLVETCRELAADLMETYLSQVNNRINEVMMVLAMVATVFLPLNFLAALYGMNFDSAASPWNMPELRMRYGYPGLLLVMATVAGLMVLLFKRKGWVFNRRRDRRHQSGPSTTTGR